MAIVLPFKAVRPAAQLASRVVSRSYESYPPERRMEILRQEPCSFLHVIDPGFRLGKKLSGPERPPMIRERYREFISKGILVRDAQPGYYLYRQTQGDHKFLGILCATSTEDYRMGIIRRHEHTLARREWLFARYLEAVRFNAEPVLMMYPEHAEVAEILELESGREPECQFVTDDGYEHAVWPIRQGSTQRRLRELFAQIGPLYIADGHHRSASSNLMALKAAAANPEHSGKEAYNFFMSLLLPESAIRIAPYQWMLSDLNQLSVNDFLLRLEQEYTVTDKGKRPWRIGKPHQFAMYLGHHFYALERKEGGKVFPGPLGQLDSHVLFETILKPVLGISNLRRNRRMGYCHDSGKQELMKEQIDAGKYAVGFGMAPVTAGIIKAIADSGLVMPPKSTYIEPKLRSGLCMYEF